MANSFLASLALSIPFGILGVLLWKRAQKKGYFLLTGKEKVPVYFLEVLLGYIFRFFSFYFVGTLFLFLQNSANFSFLAFDFWFHFFSLNLTLLLLVSYFVFFHKTLFTKVIKKRDSTFLSDIKGALFSFSMAYPLSLFFNGISQAILLIFFSSSSIEEQSIVQDLKTLAKDPTFLPLLLIGINTVFLAPLVEEFLFRGLLQNWINKWTQKDLSVLLTSLLFAFFHYQKGQQLGNIPILLSTFILSYFLGVLYEKKGSLLAPILLHAIFNLCSFLLVFVLPSL